MYTECPGCQTYFKITPNQLKAAGGKVRCGNCDEVFSALDGLVDVVPEEAVNRANSSSIETNSEEHNSETGVQSVIESQLTSGEGNDVSTAADKEPQEETVKDLPQSEALNTEALNNEVESISGLIDTQPGDAEDKSLSFADVEIPGMNNAVEDDVELALESALVSESNIENLGDAASSEVTESQTVADQEGINQDIDAALDGLFDGNTEIEPASNTELAKSKPSSISELSAISELDELQDLDFGDLGEKDNLSNGSAISSSAKLGDVLSEAPEFQSEAQSKAASKPIEETSSLSEFERELGGVSATNSPNGKSKALDESNFDLGDSFLDSEAVESKATDSKKFEAAEDSEAYSGDSFILEELDEKKTKSSGTVAKVAWVSVILILLTILLGEFAYLKRQDLAMYPEIKPVIEKLCSGLNKITPCDISAPKNVSEIELVERNVVSHPNAKNALLITSTIVNNAKFDQAFPELVLTFSDINQKIIAKRNFSPSEYLSKDVDVEQGMKKTVPIKLMLEIVDPGEEAVNFEFSFE